MPLTEPVKRELVHSRNIECRGYLRGDGLWDIEGRLTDVKTFPLDFLPLRIIVAEGGYTHNMAVRLTVDDARTLRAIEVAMDAHAYDDCPKVIPNYGQLVGLNIGRGFIRKLRELVGAAKGCTHITWLIQCLATVTLQTLVKRVSQGTFEDLKLIYQQGDSSDRLSLIDSCFGYAADGNVVRILYPQHFLGGSASAGEQPAKGSGDQTHD